MQLYVIFVSCSSSFQLASESPNRAIFENSKKKNIRNDKTIICPIVSLLNSSEQFFTVEPFEEQNICRCL